MYEDDGSLIVCLQYDSPYAIVKVDIETGEELWTYPADGLRTTRDGDLLPNGNVLLTTVDTGGTSEYRGDDISKLIEVTSAGEIVWELQAAGIPVDQSPGYFYKAERFGPNGERVGSD
jgi:outer membrane protein assembly factor BamB